MILITGSGQTTPGIISYYEHKIKECHQISPFAQASEVSPRAPEDRRRVPSPGHPHPRHGGAGQRGHGLQDPGGHPWSPAPCHEAGRDQDGLGF